MKLPKKRRRVVAVEQPRRNARRMGQSGSTAGGQQRGNGGGGDGAGLHRRMNAIKSGGGHSISHSHTNNSIPNTQGGSYRLPNAPHDKMGKSYWSTFITQLIIRFHSELIYSEIRVCCMFESRLVFCYQNCSDLLWEKKIVLVIKKNFWNLRLKAENLQNFWDHLNNLFKQWKVRTIFGNRMFF
jgi:hypothetical protein